MMHILLASIGIIASLLTQSVQAAESTSYRLYDEFPNYADRNTAESASFQMNENGQTWTSLPLVGSTFQIVTAPPAAEEAAGGTGGQTGGGGGDTGDTGQGSGGHRGEGTTTTNRPRVPTEPTEPSAPEQPTEPSAPVQPPKPPKPPKPSEPSEPPFTPDIPRLIPVPGEDIIPTIHYFQYVERSCPVLRAAASQKVVSALAMPWWFWWILILLQLLILLTILGIYYEYRKHCKSNPTPTPKKPKRS